MKNLARYRKTIVAIVGAVVAAVTAALTDGTVSAQEWVGVAFAVLTVLGVYSVPNSPPGNPVETWLGEHLATEGAPPKRP